MTPEEARIQKLEERMNDMVHKAELRELVEQWRDGSDKMMDDMERLAFRDCADELEAVFEDD